MAVTFLCGDSFHTIFSDGEKHLCSRHHMCEKRSHAGRFADGSMCLAAQVCAPQCRLVRYRHACKAVILLQVGSRVYEHRQWAICNIFECFHR